MADKDSTARKVPEIDKATQESLGLRLEDMFHSATAIYDLSIDLIESTDTKSQHLLRGIREMAKALARDLDDVETKLTGESTGYFDSHFSEA